MALGAGIVLAGDTIAWHVSIDFIGAGLATLIANTAVIFVAIGAWAFLGEKPLPTTMAAIPVILIGVTLFAAAIAVALCDALGAAVAGRDLTVARQRATGPPRLARQHRQT